MTGETSLYNNTIEASCYEAQWAFFSGITAYFEYLGAYASYASIMMSPWAKFSIFAMPYTMVYPSAMSA
jgi:hypothetical protein